MIALKIRLIDLPSTQYNIFFLKKTLSHMQLTHISHAHTGLHLFHTTIKTTMYKGIDWWLLPSY